MVAVSQSPMVIDTQDALMRSLRGRFKEDYLLRLLNKSDLQEQAERVSAEKSISIYEAWYEILTIRARA